jgi:hypothetical protein
MPITDPAPSVQGYSRAEGRFGKTGGPVDSAVLLANCAMALVGAGETGFRVCRATLVREKSLRARVADLAEDDVLVRSAAAC